MKKIFLLGIVVFFVFTFVSKGETKVKVNPIASLRYDFSEGNTTSWVIHGEFPMGTNTFVVIIPRYSSLGLAPAKKGIKVAKGFSPEEQERRFALPRAEVVKKDLLARGYSEEKIILFQPEEGGSEVRIYFFPFLLREEAKEMVLTPEQVRLMIKEELGEIQISDSNLQKLEKELASLKAKLQPLEKEEIATTATATLLPVLVEEIATTTATATITPTIPKWLEGVIIEANLPHYLRVGKEFSIPLRIDLAKGLDRSEKWWGIGVSWLPTERWEISLIGVKDEFREEKVVITDIQANYAFFHHYDLKISIGLDYGMISSFNVENIKIKGRRVLPVLAFAFERPEVHGRWNLIFYYSPEFLSLKSGGFKEETENTGINELGLSLVYQFKGGVR